MHTKTGNLIAFHLILQVLAPRNDEAWKLAEKNKTARLLVLVSFMKTSCCAAPLLKDQRYGEEMAETIARSINFLPTELSACILKILDASSEFGVNTYENVDLFMKKIIDELVIEGKIL